MSVSMKDPGSSIDVAVQTKESTLWKCKSKNVFCNQLQTAKTEMKALITLHPQEWISAFRFNSSYSLFTKGDIDGFMALFINNLATLLAVIASLLPTLGNEIVYGKIVPGMALSMLWGNLYYVYMARKLAFKEKRADVCAMPYGINTPGAFAFIFVIIVPAFYGCMSEQNDERKCQELAWHVAIASNFITGIMILLFCLCGEFIRKNVPSVALLASISGIGFAFLALNEYLSIAEIPIVAFVPFAIVMLGYFGGVKYGPIPVAFLALVIGTFLGWITFENKISEVQKATEFVKLYAPVFPVKEMFAQFSLTKDYLSTIIPTAISIAIGTIQCVESAKRAGDFYPTREIMFADGMGTVVGSFFGSFLGMTTYIGHPAYKVMGAKQGYSIINGVAFLPLCFLGINALILRLISVVSIKPIIIFIGLIICTDTLAITPKRHYPAFLLGIMSIVADWAKGTVVNSISAAYDSFNGSNVKFANISSQINGLPYRGLVNFAGGAQLQCIFLVAIMIYMIDRKFVHATVSSILAALFAYVGLINSSEVGISFDVHSYRWKSSVAYLLIALLFTILEFAQRMQWIKEQETEPDDLSTIEWAEWKRQQLLEQTNEANEKLKMTA